MSVAIALLREFVLAVHALIEATFRVRVQMVFQVWNLAELLLADGAHKALVGPACLLVLNRERVPEFVLLDVDTWWVLILVLIWSNYLMRDVALGGRACFISRKDYCGDIFGPIIYFHSIHYHCDQWVIILLLFDSLDGRAGILQLQGARQLLPLTILCHHVLLLLFTNITTFY